MGSVNLGHGIAPEPLEQAGLIIVEIERDRGWRCRVGDPGCDLGQHDLGDEGQVEVADLVQLDPLQV